MSKKLAITLAILMVVVLGGVSGYFILSSRQNFGGSSFPFVPNQPEAVKGDLTYSDDSGFSFNYPTGVKVSDITPDDDSYYTMLILDKGDGKITITVKDLKSGEDKADGSLTGAISLGGVSAKQYTNGSKLTTIATDQGILYKIEGPKDSGFWEGTQNVVVSTFAFAGSQKLNSQGLSDDTAYEEEEIVE